MSQTEAEEEQLAATKLQSLYRGNQDRKRAATIKEGRGPAGAPQDDGREDDGGGNTGVYGGQDLLADDAILRAEEEEGEEVLGEDALAFDVEEIVQTCLRNGTLFEDPHFPAADRSLYKNPFEYPAYVSHGVGASSWRRPEQISRSAVIFADGRPTGDLSQGDLRDAWLLGAMAVVSMRPDLISRNFAHVEYQRDAGLIVCRLFKEGEWKEILIDTRLPYSDSVDARRPTYGHCPTNKEEMWCPLLEKAVAKYMGSYEALHQGGSLADALVDLTGGSVESFDLTSAQIQSLVQSGEMWHFVRNWFVSGCLLCCVVEEEDAGHGMDDHAEGILPNLAYGILDIAEVDGLKMIRIRNPWGESEWKGAFADHDQMWNKHPELKDRLKYEFGPDGTWWMRFEDWVGAYKKLHVCRLFPQSYQQHVLSGVWHELSAAGAPQPLEQRMPTIAEGGDAAGMGKTWKSEGTTNAAGETQRQLQQVDPDPRWFNNPQYRIHIKDASKPVTLFLSLMQSEQSQQYVPMNMMVLKAKPAGRLWDCIETDLLGTAMEQPQQGGSSPPREVTYEMALHPAETGQHYILVAYIDQAKPDPSMQHRFYLRVFASEQISVEALPPPTAESFSCGWEPHSSAGGRRLRLNKMENSNWCRNPQIFLNFKRPTSLKIVLERQMGRKKHQPQGITCGFVVTRLNSTSEAHAVTKNKKTKANMGTTGAGVTGGIRPPKQIVPELGNPKRKLQVLPNDWVQETSFALEDMACMHLTVTPQQGPLVVVPSLSEEAVQGQFSLSVFSDRPLKDALLLNEKKDVVLPGQWTAESAGGSHLYSPPFEVAKAATWRNNPRFALTIPTRTQVHITLARCERPWRQQIAKDAVGCMLGFYVLGGVNQQAGGGQAGAEESNGILRELVVAETNFVPSHEVSLDVTLAACAPDAPYLIVPCCYDPGKVGEFMVRVCSEGRFDFESLDNKRR